MKILTIIAPTNYQDYEYGTIKDVLEKNGHTVITASTSKFCTGSRGGNTNADLLFNEINVDDYDAIIFIGGPGCHIFFDDKNAQNLAKSFFEKEKLTTAICSAPAILANSGILNGKISTCFPDEQEILISKGAKYTGNEVEKDGIIITGNGPQASENFAKEIVKALK